VLVLAPSNLPASLPADASMLYARNVTALLLHLFRDGRLHLDPQDEILAGALLTHGGEVLVGTAAQPLAGVTA
jgi:NAD(P) transhydrogenase subunit alpha